MITRHSFLRAWPRGFVAVALILASLPRAAVAAEPHVAVIIDDSQGMREADDYPAESRAAKAVARLAADLGLKGSPTRLQQAQALLTRKGGGWLKELAVSRKSRVTVYHLGGPGKAARVCELGPGDGRGLHEACQKVLALKPLPKATPLYSAVARLLEEASPTAIILLTDGSAGVGDEFRQTARRAGAAGVPLFIMALGDDTEIPEISLQSVRAPERIEANEVAVIEAEVVGRGCGAMAVTVLLREKGKPLATVSVRLDPTGHPVRVRLEHRWREAGEKALTVTVELPAKKPARLRATDLRAECRVLVREPKRLRVLYVEGTARPEYRAAAAALRHEANVQFRTLLLDAGPDAVKADAHALAAFPTREELSAYDAVILGDADPGHDKLGAKNLKNLAWFVAERGGGLLLIAGERHNPGAFKGTALEGLLPVEPGAAPKPEAPAHTPRLTPAGARHPIFRFDPDPARALELWKGLPHPAAGAGGVRARDGAEVLSVRGAPGEKGEPLAAVRSDGAGRVLYFGAAETWRWRKDHEALHSAFWRQTVRLLAGADDNPPKLIDRAARGDDVRRRPDHAALREAAGLSRGRFHTFDDTEALPDNLPGRR